MQKKTVKLGNREVSPKTAAKIRKQPGKSNAGKYQNVKSKDFAGADGTYPINTLQRAKSAKKLAHNAKNPQAILNKVYAKYPQLKPQSKGGRA